MHPFFSFIPIHINTFTNTHLKYTYPIWNNYIQMLSRILIHSRNNSRSSAFSVIIITKQCSIFPQLIDLLKQRTRTFLCLYQVYLKSSSCILPFLLTKILISLCSKVWFFQILKGNRNPSVFCSHPSFHPLLSDSACIFSSPPHLVAALEWAVLPIHVSSPSA